MYVSLFRYLERYISQRVTIQKKSPFCFYFVLTSEDNNLIPANQCNALEWSVAECLSWEFQCENGECINIRGCCDGIGECRLGDDENDCGGYTFFVFFYEQRISEHHPYLNLSERR